MMTADEPSAESIFAELSRQLRAGRTVEESYQLISDAAVSVIEGCDHAGIGVLDGDTFRTAASSDDVVRVIDKLQDQAGEGPCLDAGVEQRPQHDNDLTDGSKWPKLGEQIVARTTVRAALAFPLVHEGRRTGALNLFGDRPGAFSDHDIDLGAILAAFAVVASEAAAQRERADQLQQGLSTNREIGAAVGILMATHGISSEEAFAILSQASQRLNRKLRDVAAGIVRGDSTGRP